MRTRGASPNVKGNKDHLSQCAFFLFTPMPVTFFPAKHLAESRDVKPVTPAQILWRACPQLYEQVDQLWQYSIGGQSGTPNTVFKIEPNKNGFVNTIMSAWGQHHSIVIRPDDVWLAIISQFSFYVNANAELLRANFVAHEGKKELVVDGLCDFAWLSRQMGDMIHKNVVDPSLCEWILPKFSTTTINDTTIGSMLMMATMKKYFDYRMGISCGIPRVTLEGERQDWELVLHRLGKLKEYGLQTIAWYHLLHPIISRFVKAFDDPNSPENLDFWQRVACEGMDGYGTSVEWSGWISAFCVFSADGLWQGPWLDTTRLDSRAPESMSSRRFWSSYTTPLQETRPHLTIDGTKYPVISQEQVPSGYAEVDVTVDLEGATFSCVIVAGFVGMGFSSSRDLSVSKTGKNDTVRPVLAWWIYSKRDVPEKNSSSEADQGRQSAESAVRVDQPVIPEVLHQRRTSFLKRLFKF
ncbi:hypothetical protein MVEN_00941800 [Mycena venus]|uniref:Uncharacterized protein n=1 Tax=Mycena venus TaxID=2733690 RepID=A0A8H6YBU4_9AGAR|nr:hypothetical protein MVEN_00941800 [Mycena venus]